MVKKAICSSLIEKQCSDMLETEEDCNGNGVVCCGHCPDLVTCFEDNVIECDIVNDLCWDAMHKIRDKHENVTKKEIAKEIRKNIAERFVSNESKGGK